MTPADQLRAEVLRMFRQGSILPDERAEAMAEIAKGRGEAALAFLRRQVAG